MCVLAVLAYRNSVINDKVNHSNIFLAFRKKKLKKKKKPIKSKRKTYDLFHQKTAFQNEVTQKSCTFHDILTTLLSRGCKVLSFFRLCIKVGRGQGDGDIGTRVWGLGTWGRETGDLRTSSMGRGDAWDGDVGTSKTGTQGTRDVNDYHKSRR